MWRSDYCETTPQNSKVVSLDLGFSSMLLCHPIADAGHHQLEDDDDAHNSYRTPSA
jgi:hypothetical protein